MKHKENVLTVMFGHFCSQFSYIVLVYERYLFNYKREPLPK